MNKSNFLQTAPRNLSINSQLSNTLPSHDIPLAEDFDTHLAVVKDAVKKKQLKKAYKINHKYILNAEKKLKMQQNNQQLGALLEDGLDIFAQIRVYRLQLVILGHLQSRCLFHKASKYPPSFKIQIFGEQLVCLKKVYRLLTLIQKKVRPQNVYFPQSKTYEEYDFRQLDLLSEDSQEEEQRRKKIYDMECRVQRGLSQQKVIDQLNEQKLKQQKKRPTDFIEMLQTISVQDIRAHFNALEFNAFMFNVGNFYYQYLKFCVKQEYPQMGLRIAEIGNKVADCLSQSVNPTLIQLCVRLKMCYARFLMDQRQVDQAEKILSQALNHCQYEMNLRQHDRACKREMNQKMMISILYCLAVVFNLKEDYARLLESVKLLEYLNESFLANTHPMYRLVKRLVGECATKLGYFLKLKGDYHQVLHKQLKHDLGIQNLLAHRPQQSQKLYSQVSRHLYDRFNNAYLNKSQNIRVRRQPDEVLAKIQLIKKQPIQRSLETSHTQSETNDITPHSEDPFSMPAESFMTPMVSIRAIQKHLSNKRHARLNNEDDQCYYFKVPPNHPSPPKNLSADQCLNLTGQMEDLFQKRAGHPVLTPGVLLNRITRLHKDDQVKARILAQQARLLRIRNKEGLQERPQEDTAYFKNKSASLKKFQLQLEEQQEQYQKQIEKFRHTFELDNQQKVANSPKARFDRVIARIVEEKKLEKTKLSLASKTMNRSPVQEERERLRKSSRNKFNNRDSQQNRVVEYMNKEARLKENLKAIAKSRENQRQKDAENPKQARRKQKRENRRMQQIVEVHLGYNKEEREALECGGLSERQEREAQDNHALLQHYSQLYMSTFKADRHTPPKSMAEKMGDLMMNISRPA